LLNPGAVGDSSIQPSSGAEADIEDADDIVASKDAKAFGAIPYGNYQASLRFIQDHPSIVNPKDSDGLLAEAFSAQMEGKEKYALQCVHQSLLISYCRQLGKDGVSLFFKRITTKDHSAYKLFTEDVQTTYKRIKTRVAEMEREKAEAPAGVEQIQLQAVDPNTTINIKVPPPIPTDLSAESSQPPPTEEEIAGRHIFETFPPNLQRALEQGSLDEINRVLGKMSVDEAEEVVAKLSEGGMLSVEQGILDATTEEGQKVYEEIKRTGQLPSDRPNDDAMLSEDPPLE
jgi:cell division cycle protein 37